MTDLEKINRPVIYENKSGYLKTCCHKNTKYTFNNLFLGTCIVHCFSLLNDDKTDIIAGFRVTKIHDTRRENN